MEINTPDSELFDSAARRFGLPHCPEHELWYYGRLFRPELEPRRKTLSAARRPEELIARARLRRLLGDRAGAAGDLRAALDSSPDLPWGHIWLAELDLRDSKSRASLDLAVALEGAPPAAWLYRGGARLLAGLASAAEEDLRVYLGHRPDSAIGNILLGRSLERQGRPREAIPSYLSGAQAPGAGPAGHLLAARLLRGENREAALMNAFDAEPDYAHLALFQHGEKAGWRRYLDTLLEFSFQPDRTQALCARFADENIRFSPYHLKTVRLAEGMLKAHPGRAWSHALLGRALARMPGSQRRGPESRNHLDRAASLAPGRGWPLAWRALARQGTDLKGAERDLNAGLRRQPFYYRAYAWRGALKRRLGRPAEGLVDLDRAASVDGGYPFTLHERSLARRALGDWAGSVLELDRAFRLDFRYCWVYTSGREPSPAEMARGLVQLERAVRRHPRLASLRAWRAELLGRMGRGSEALLELDRAVHLDPHHAMASALQGRLLMEMKGGRAGLAPLRRATALEEDVAVFQGWLADAEAAAGNPRKGLAILAEIMRRFPRSWWAELRRGRIWLLLGQPRRALASARLAARYEGRDAQVYLVEAHALMALGKLAEAERAVGRALLISPHLGQAYLLRAAIRQRAGRPVEVLDDYRTVLRDFPYLFNAGEKARIGELLNSHAA